MKNLSYTTRIIFLALFLRVTDGFAEPPKLIPPLTITPLDKEISRPTSKVEIRGLIKPLREATLSTNRIAKIAHINFKEGDSFKKDEKLVQFDCLQQRAEEKAMEAEASAKELILKNNQDLSQFNAVGSLELEVSKAQYDKAMADLNVLKIRNWECTIKAPWDGRVTEVKAHKFEVIEPGREIMKILDDSSLEIEMIVPSKWLVWIQPGINCPVIIDETGKSYESYITRIGARVDPVSQTIRIFASFKGDASDVLAGMSGKVIFDLPDN
ncbi:HlyD family efflux transporter periplasmic adaptor subunit [Nitrosomonas sp.]|uniref:efflux RND transporter periplasmic adaptor subunit n=1 Tax=Nitrosomonas sp. TaxID=42353 RepID=UPI00262278C6|nr:HlyD family efflux transporter periplasmic adaptor subunit [Nitrosomonas sp.]